MGRDKGKPRAGATCIAPLDDVVHEGARALEARLCGQPATTTRVVEGLTCALCAAHAAEDRQREGVATMETTTMAEATESAIRIIPVRGALDLHEHYRGQTSAQPCYVELDCDEGTLRCVVSGEIGSGVPARVWHGRTRRWHVEALKADAANALLEEIAPLCAELVDEYECVWNGSNHVGELSERGAELVDAVARAIEAHEPWSEHERVSVWDAGDWFGGIGTPRAQRRELEIDATTSDAELAEIVTREEGRAADEGVDVLEGVDTHLTRLRDEARDELIEAVATASTYAEDADMRAAVALWLAWWGDADAAAIAAAYDASVDADEVYTAPEGA